jgi:hypothetical protein
MPSEMLRIVNTHVIGSAVGLLVDGNGSTVSCVSI